MMTPSEARQSACVLWIKTPVRAGPARVQDAACLWEGFHGGQQRRSDRRLVLEAGELTSRQRTQEVLETPCFLMQFLLISSQVIPSRTEREKKKEKTQNKVSKTERFDTRAQKSRVRKSSPAPQRTPCTEMVQTPFRTKIDQVQI